MKASQKAYDLVMHFESLRLRSYRDSVGVLTVGFGHTRRVSPGMIITEEEAYSLLIDDMDEVEYELNRMIKIDLLQHQFDALMSLVFNIGGDKFRKSTLLRMLNEEAPKTSQQFCRWVKGKKPGSHLLMDLPGLKKRRLVEKKLFETGELILEEVDVKL